MIRISLLLALIVLCGCTGTTREAQTATIRQETKQGTENGQPVNTITVIREQVQEQSEAKTNVDVSASIQAALAGLRGDIPGLIRAALPEVKPVDFSPVFARMDAAKPSGIDWPTIVGGGTAALLGGGFGVMKHQEAKRQRADANEAWTQNQKALAMLPPEQAAKVLAL